VLTATSTPGGRGEDKREVVASACLGLYLDIDKSPDGDQVLFSREA